MTEYVDAAHDALTADDVRAVAENIGVSTPGHHDSVGAALEALMENTVTGGQRVGIALRLAGRAAEE